MQFHPEEFALARSHAGGPGFEPLTAEQVRLIRNRAAELHGWFHTHPNAHRILNLAVLLLLLAADAAALLLLPRLILAPGWLPLIAASLATGLVHAWIIYSLTVFTIHEGVAHNLILPGSNGLLCGLLARIGGADPASYAQSHRSHHSRFGTEHDGEFLNFVQPRRFWRSLLPYGLYLNHSDFLVHRGLAFTRSQFLSLTLSAAYSLFYGYWMAREFGIRLPLIAIGFVLPHAGFYLDRLRQFTEHDHMPLENSSGARSFGLGFWGMLIGGGPWGQPCHWMHHLAPSLPWYQQIRLHRFTAALLTPRQRSQFLLEPVTGFPKLVAKLLGTHTRSVSVWNGSRVEIASTGVPSFQPNSRS